MPRWIFIVFRTLVLLGLCLGGLAAHAQTTPGGRDVHFIWLGGDDCPNCIAWRNAELRKLEKTEAFKQVRFSYVTKFIRSPVPPRFLLPEEVKPLKEKLDIASGGRNGSPQGAIVVDGEVYHYFFGSRNASAEQVEKMLIAASTGTDFPVKRCVRFEMNPESRQWRCAARK